MASILNIFLQNEFLFLFQYQRISQLQMLLDQQLTLSKYQTSHFKYFKILIKMFLVCAIGGLLMLGDCIQQYRGILIFVLSTNFFIQGQFCIQSIFAHVIIVQKNVFLYLTNIIYLYFQNFCRTQKRNTIMNVQVGINKIIPTSSVYLNDMVKGSLCVKSTCLKRMYVST